MKNCPDEPLAAIAELLRIGLLRVRRAAASGDAALCMIEADHLHNLPVLIERFSDELLNFYLTVERPAYLAQLNRHAAGDAHHRDVRQMETLWSTLEKAAHAQTSSAS